jgi:hypothetical protein
MLYGRGQSQYEIEQEIARQFPNLSAAQRKAIEYKALDSAGAHPSDPRMQAAAKVMLDNGAWEYNPNAPETQQKAERAAGRLKEAEYIAAHASPYPTDDMHRLGEGGMAGQQFPDGYGWESRDAAAANTARSQLFQPDFATSDYARHFLATNGCGRSDDERATLGAAHDARRTATRPRNRSEYDHHRHISERPRPRQVAGLREREGGVRGSSHKGSNGTEATVRELLAQPGNYNDTIGKAVAALQAGNKDARAITSSTPNDQKAHSRRNVRTISTPSPRRGSATTRSASICAATTHCSPTPPPRRRRAMRRATKIPSKTTASTSTSGTRNSATHTTPSTTCAPRRTTRRARPSKTPSPTRRPTRKDTARGSRSMGRNCTV